jgi:hypothetical protein
MAPTLVSITGSLYTTSGAKITSGRLTIRPSRFMISNGSLISASPVTVDVPGSGNLSFSLAPSGGVSYTVTFDPTPLDTATPVAMKSGYFKRSWVVPASGPVDLASL